MLYKFRWVIAAIITTMAVVLFALVLWFVMAIRPANLYSNQVIFYQLKPGTSVDGLAAQLKAAGIIKSSFAFKVLVTLEGLRPRLKAGSYELQPRRSSHYIARQLAEGRVAVRKLAVPEGAEVTTIRELARVSGISASQFDEALKAPYNNPFLASRPAGYHSLEGYLFPDSYVLSLPLQPRMVIQVMLDTFGKKINHTDIIQSFATQGLTLHQGVTLASIVEKEVGNSSDRAMVAGVFFNRLRSGQRLETDPTVAYAANLMGKPFSTDLDSPYNTYRNGGLPPGPICSPSLSALQAVAHPTKHDYFYFISDKQGKMHYAKTLNEHNANVKAYL